MSKVYRFHASTTLPATTTPVLLKKRKRRLIAEPILVAADLSTVTDENGTRAIDKYQIIPGRRSVTLTRRESDLIALSNPGMLPPSALEDIHPWLPRRPFLNDSAASFDIVVSIIRQYGRHLVSAAAFCDEKWNTICNSLRMRSGLDTLFYTAWHLPIQDVHILEERRPDRNVVAIDFNGMYPACMQHSFPKPSSLRLVHYDRPLESADNLPSGLYRCVLDGPATDFIRSHNPFCSFFSGRHLRAALSEPVEVDLNEFEIAFYKRHFSRIYLVHGVVSDKEIPHPLAKEVRRSFARRQNYIAQGNKALADREKYLATLMSSCANRPARERRMFGTRDEALEKLHADYGINPPADEPEVAMDKWLQGRKRVTVGSSGDNIAVDAPNLRDGFACFLLGQRIVARGRIVLLGMMERILSVVPNVQICYTNIDSVHFSLPIQHLDTMMNWLIKEASDHMGSFKIEAVTEHGLWLEPGRYWLYSDVVEKFRNRSVGDPRNPFKDHAIHVTSRRTGDLHIPVRATLRMDRTMSDSRQLVSDPETGLVRQRLIEVGAGTTFGDVLNELEQQQRLVAIRMAAFAALEQRINESRLAATRRDRHANVM